MSILCTIGFHRYEEDPSHKEFIRSTGLHFLFCSSGVQFGVKECSICGKKLNVYRSGIVGFGSRDVGRWKYCSPSKKKYIDSLPIL